MQIETQGSGYFHGTECISTRADKIGIQYTLQFYYTL